MARIDMLTAQMRQRAVSRASIQSDEKIQLFDANDQLLGAGAALPEPTIRELLTQIAPVPLDGTPVAFPYSGRDGEFEVLVAPATRGFEIRTLSFAPAQSEPLQTHSTPQTQIIQPDSAPAVPLPVADEWYYMAGDQQIGPQTSAQIKGLVRSGGIRRDTYLWREGMGEWQSVSHSEFRSLLPSLPNTTGDSENAWYYRSMTGQPVPVEKAALVEKIRSGQLTSDAWVYRLGMSDWASASATELASTVSARPVGLAPVGAPISSPTGGGVPRTLPGAGAYNLYGGDPENTSGNGEDAIMPQKAKGLFNMGAFLFPVLWCRSMGMDSWATGIFVLNIASRFIPFVGLVKLPLCAYMGVMGNKLAWSNRRFDSVEDFKKCQLMWGLISSAIWGFLIVLGFLFWGWVESQVPGMHSGSSASGQTFTAPPNTMSGSN